MTIIARPAVDRMYIFTQSLALFTLFSILAMGLLPALLGGLLVYFIVEFGAKILGRAGIIPVWGRIILLALLALILVSGLVLAGLVSASYVSSGPESIVVLIQRMADIVDTARNYLPLWMHQYLPVTIEEWQQATATWLRENAGYFSVFGRELGVFFLHVVIGMIIGGMIALTPAFQSGLDGPLSLSLAERIRFLGTAFHRIVFSQIRISALNTILTGIFLVVILPMTGYPLPFTKTMIAVTFLVGLLPVVGNLISNTVIFLIALSVSPSAAIGSLVFLVVIHKLEYFFNAHIIGTRIRARAWELLIAMLVMETMFGLSGLVAAPIFYAYLKDELSGRRLI
ncbi:MAG: hypothetical protein K9G62_03835 [Alphaproteobacteria bacterium]|nr:hypothetical protein [Alphaproteobacteria bacterium]